MLITTPPSHDQAVDAEVATKLCEINTWLVYQWLARYLGESGCSRLLTMSPPLMGGNPLTKDVGVDTGSHHRYWNGAIEHLLGPSNFLAYSSC